MIKNDYKECFERICYFIELLQQFFKSNGFIKVDWEQDKQSIQELIDKATPIKPDLEGDGYDGEGNIIYDTAICPICHRNFEIDYDEHVRYCPDCGQKMDWSDEEDE